MKKIIILILIFFSLISVNVISVQWQYYDSVTCGFSCLYGYDDDLDTSGFYDPSVSGNATSTILYNIPNWIQTNATHIYESRWSISAVNKIKNATINISCLNYSSVLTIRLHDTWNGVNNLARAECKLQNGAYREIFNGSFFGGNTESLFYQRVGWGGLLPSLITINYNDSNTKESLNYLNITSQYIARSYQDQQITDDGNVSYTHQFSDTTIAEFGVTETVSIRSFETNGIDYSIVVREIDVTRGDNTTITIYLTNTSDLTTTKLVSLHAQDELKNNLEGAIIHILKQDPSTNQFLTINDLTTNANGIATTILEIDTIFYKFLVDYKGERIYTTSNAFTISSNDDDLYLVGSLTEPYTEFFDTFFDTNVNLFYTNISNSTGTFTTDWSGTSIVESCLKILIVNKTGVTVNETICENETSGSQTSSVLRVKTGYNTTMYVAQVFIDAKDGDGKRFIRSLSQELGLDLIKFFGSDFRENIFILTLVVVFCAFGFVMNPIAGISIATILFPVVYMTKITYLNLSALMLIETFLIITIFTISRRK